VSGRWRIELTPGLTPKHWRFFRGDEDLPRFTLGEITDGAALDVLEALNAYGQTDEDIEDEDFAALPCLASLGVHDCIRPQGHEGPHACDDECNRGHLRLRDVAALAAVEDADPQCITCEDKRWLPNDEAESEADPVWKPCPDCNPKGAIPCPYVFKVVEA